MRMTLHNLGARCPTFWPLLIVVVLGLALTAFCFWQIRAAQLARFRFEFQEDAETRSALVVNQAEEGLLIVKALGRFLEDTGDPDVGRFQAFAGPFAAQHDALEALEWIPRISAAERPGFEQQVAQREIYGFHLTELNASGQLVAAGEREVLYPILYIEPLQRNEAGVGYDVGSDPVRLAALRQARDSGEPALAGPFRLLQDSGRAEGCVIFVPVYRQGMMTDSPQQRRAAVIGFGGAVLRIGSLVEAAFHTSMPAGLAMDLIDHTAPSQHQRLCHRDEPGPPVHAWEAALFPAPPELVRNFTFVGHPWSVVITAGPAYLRRHAPTSYWLVLPAGWLLTGLLTLYLRTLLVAQHRMEQLVAERTAELAQSREMLRLVLDAIPVRVHWKNRDSVYLGGNRPFARDAELDTPEQLTGKTDFDLPWKQYAELYRSRDRQVIQSGEPMLDYEQPRNAADGRTRLLRQSKLPLRDAGGRVIGVLSTYEDITERKRAEQALRESEARFRALVEYSPEGIAVTVDDELVYVNPATLKMLGVEQPEGILGREVLDFVPEELHAEVLRRRTAMRQTGLPAPPLEGKVRRPDGSIFDAESVVAPFVYAGKPAVLHCFRDITQQKQQASAIRSILHATAGSGEQFFSGLVAELARSLGVKYAFVAAPPSGRSDSLRTVALWGRGALLPNCEYSLEGTPCANVLGKELCHYPDQLCRQFPRHRLLAEMGAESYLGIPLFSAAGAQLGVLGVLDERPMPSSDLAVSLMRIFAARAAGELERMQTVTALTASEAKYRHLHESLIDAFASVDQEGQLQEFNEVYRRMLGYEKEELLKLSYQELTPEKWHAFEADIYRTQVLVRGYSDIYQKEYRRKDGTVFPVELRAVLLRDDTGQASGAWAIVRDITERKRAERLLAGEKHLLEGIARRKPLPEVLKEICRLIEDLSPGVMSSILLLDPDGSRLWPAAAPGLPQRWTRAITPLAIGPKVGSCGTAAARREPVVVSDIAVDPLWADYPEARDLALQSGLRACWSTPIFAGDGRLFGTFALYYHEARSPQPKELEVITQVSHLTSIAIEHDQALEGLRRARDELEQRVRERTAELVRANERLRELDRLKSQFLATISHELRTPLNSIIGFTGLLRRGFAGPVNAEQKKQLDLACGAGKHLLSLINDLLDLSRIEAGKVDLDLRSFNFAEVAAEVVELLTPMADQKHLGLEASLSPASIPMFGDRKRTFQVLLNLVNNALKFTNQGQVDITARAADGRLRVSVADTGIGIPPEQMSLLFEAFRQLDSSASRPYEGTGLGLYLSRKLVMLMHGEISVQSEPGKGSRFTVTLPLRLSEPAPDAHVNI